MVIGFPMVFDLLQKKSTESINNKLQLVMKSGKYTLGYKTVLKTLRNSKGIGSISSLRRLFPFPFRRSEWHIILYFYDSEGGCLPVGLLTVALNGLVYILVYWWYLFMDDVL